VARARRAGLADEDHSERLHPRVRARGVIRAILHRLSRGSENSAPHAANGTYLVVDGIQGIGNSALDVTETPIDILACGGQKWLLSPWGSGFIYVRKELVGQLEPMITGWMAFEGTDDFSRLTEYNPTFRSDARRFEMVTLPYQDFVGMTASLQLLLEIGVRDIAEVTRATHEPIVRWAREHGVRITSPTENGHRSAILCIAPAKPAEAYHGLKRARIVCSLREGVRLSPHCYNTVEEMERSWRS
jgi:selenocysteine lyase/cysteine desulfurase